MANAAGGARGRSADVLAVRVGGNDDVNSGASPECPKEGGSSAQEQESLSLDVLPDEVMLMVLAELPWEELLGLRLVSRRWSYLLLSAPLWPKSRTSTFDFGERRLLAILRLVQAIDTVKIVGNYKKAAIRALAEGDCKVRSLHLEFTVVRPYNVLFCEALEKRRHCLEELHLELIKISKTNGTLEALAAVDGLSLTELEIGFPTKSKYKCPAYIFKSLRSLRKLTLRRGLNARMVQSLLELCKGTLELLDIERYDVADQLVHCDRLRELCMSSSKHLPQVHLMTHLEVLDVSFETPQDLFALKDYLERDQLPVDVRVSVNLRHHYCMTLQSPFLQAAASFRNVRRLSLISFRWRLKPAYLLHCLEFMHELEELILVDDNASNYDWNRVVKHWSATSAPKLKRLTASRGVHFPEHCLRDLRALRPGLEISGM